MWRFQGSELSSLIVTVSLQDARLSCRVSALRRLESYKRARTSYATLCFLQLIFHFSIRQSIMSSNLARLRFAAHLFSSRHQSDQQSSSITTARNLPWHRINGPAHDSLLPEFQKMYWNGVKRELAHILLTVERSASFGPGDPMLGSSIPYGVER